MNEKNVVVIGAGFGGLFCAHDLRKANVKITIIDKHNHHLFQPLLYQVATGFLAPNDIALPVRSLFRHQSNVEIVMAEVNEIDPAAKCVYTPTGKYNYDYLVVATGATYHYFGQEQWQDYTVAIKSVEDALHLKRSIFMALEKAEIEKDPLLRRQLLTFVIIGGGPTGVEIAGAIADLIDYLFKREFRHIRAQDAKVVLVEAGERLLGTMPEKLSAYAQTHLEKMGVTVQCQTRVLDVQPMQVKTSHEVIAASTIIWAAGIRATPVAKWMNLGEAPITVQNNLAVPGLDNVFVIGDASVCMENGKPLPGLAAVAKQQGKYLAQLLKHKLKDQPFTKKFHYVDLGTMATIGRNAAVADFGKIGLKGFFAWVLWSIVHVYFLIGFRNRLVVSLSWLWSYITFGVGDRILTASQEENKP